MRRVTIEFTAIHRADILISDEEDRENYIYDDSISDVDFNDSFDKFLGDVQIVERHEKEREVA